MTLPKSSYLFLALIVYFVYLAIANPDALAGNFIGLILLVLFFLFVSFFPPALHGEFMVSLFIIAILLVSAMHYLPKKLDQAKFAEALVLASAFQGENTIYYAQKGEFPASSASISVKNEGGYVRFTDYSQGVAHAELRESKKNGEGVRLSFRPLVPKGSASILQWTCGRYHPPNRRILGENRTTETLTLNPACR